MGSKAAILGSAYRPFESIVMPATWKQQPGARIYKKPITLQVCIWMSLRPNDILKTLNEHLNIQLASKI